MHHIFIGIDTIENFSCSYCVQFYIGGRDDFYNINLTRIIVAGFVPLNNLDKSITLENNSAMFKQLSKKFLETYKDEYFVEQIEKVLNDKTAIHTKNFW